MIIYVKRYENTLHKTETLGAERQLSGRSTGGFFCEPELSSQHPHCKWQSRITPVPGYLIPYCFLHSEQTGMSCTDIRADEILKHVKIKTEKLMSVLLTKLNDKQKSKHFAIIHDKTQGVL